MTDIDHLCEALKNKKHEPSQQPKEKMVLISFHLPKKMLEDADKYAKMQGIKRSEVIRRAVDEMLKKYRGLSTSSAGLEPH
jgi:ribosomal protein L30E